MMMTGEMQSLWQRLGLVAQAMPSLAELRELQDANEHAQAFGPFIDPTAFMQLDHETVRLMRELLDAGIAFAAVAERTIPVLQEKQRAATR